MKKILIALLAVISSIGANNIDSIKYLNLNRMRAFSAVIHHHVKSYLNLGDLDAADNTMTIFFAEIDDEPTLISDNTPQKNQENIYFNASKALPNELAKTVIYECAEAAQDMRRKGKVFAENQIRFNSICPCDFYKNLTDKQLEDIKQGAQQ